MKTRKTFDSVRGSSIRKLQGGMSLLAVLTLLSLGVLGSGCGGVVSGGAQCSDAIPGAYVQGGDFRNCVLNSKDLSETDFSFSDFDGAELNNAYFWLGTLSYPYLPAVLVETKFTNVEAVAVDFTNADLMGADFRPDTPGGTDLRDAVFAGAYLDEARLNGGIDLRDADFQDAWLDCANLQDADLRGVNFTGASLVNADLSGAQLTGAIFDGAVVNGACFNGATGYVFTVLPAPNPTIGTVSTTAASCVPIP